MHTESDTTHINRTRNVIDTDGENIFFSIRRASMIRYVSFGGVRLSKRRIFRILPELAEMEKNFASKSLPTWRKRMLDHNKVLERGARMRLCTFYSISRVLATSFDQYLLQMHSIEIAKLLESMVIFGERVAPLIRSKPFAAAWWLHRDILIQRQHWISLCRSVMAIVRLTRDPDIVLAPESDPWPGREVLEEAAQAATYVFGQFRSGENCSANPDGRQN